MSNFRPQVYIGFDPKEEVAFDVLRYSIKKFCPQTDIHALIQSELRRQGLYTRERDPKESTEFSLTRFLVPHLQDYKGWALFMDCDMMVTTNIMELFELADPKFAVQVVKHFHEPFSKVKMDNQQQTKYPKKNWSSTILFNCGHIKNRNLTPEVISTVQPSFLHRFEWLDEYADIGELPLVWNFLVDYYKAPKGITPKNLHWTSGGPWFDNYKNCDYANYWNDMYREMRESLDY